MMVQDNDQINGFDVDRIFGDFSIDIVKENIETQMQDPLMYEEDYCDDVYQVISDAREELDHIDEYKQEINEIEDEFNKFLIDKLNDKFNLDIDLYALEDYQISEMAKNCYEFFVINLRENLKRFLFNYIMDNKLQLAEMLDGEYKRKDVTTLNMKKSLKNKEDVLIMSNLIDVINYILDLEFDPSDFIEWCSEPGEVCSEYIKEATNSFLISGNYVPAMINELRYSHNDIIDEIASSIRLDYFDSLQEDDFIN